MQKGKIQRDKGNLVNGSYTYFGELILKGLEFKLKPLKIPFEEHKSNNPRTIDPYIVFIKKLLNNNRVQTEKLRIKIINENNWEIFIED